MNESINRALDEALRIQKGMIRSGCDGRWHGSSVILLSPHPDDIALSAAGWLVGRPRRLLMSATLITAFSKSSYVADEGERDIGVVSNRRGQEDARFAQRLGIRYRALGLPDSSVQGMTDIEQLSVDHRSDERLAILAAKLSRLIKACDILICPLALGGHVDHRIVREVCAAIRCRVKLWYEDLPYAAELSLDEIHRCVKRLPGPRPTPIFVRFTMAEKRRLLRIYASQLLSVFDQILTSHAQKVGRSGVATERIWRQRTATWPIVAR